MGTKVMLNNIEQYITISVIWSILLLHVALCKHSQTLFNIYQWACVCGCATCTAKQSPHRWTQRDRPKHRHMCTALDAQTQTHAEHPVSIKCKNKALKVSDQKLQWSVAPVDALPSVYSVIRNSRWPMEKQQEPPQVPWHLGGEVSAYAAPLGGWVTGDRGRRRGWEGCPRPALPRITGKDVDLKQV